MNFNDAKAYLLGKPEALLDYPFGPEIAVFKVHKKMFATLIEIKGSPFSNLKCDPEESIMLRDLFPEVIPAYHMNKKHWNTVQLDGNLPRGEIERMVDNSYTLVVKSLPKRIKQSLEIKYGSETFYR